MQLINEQSELLKNYKQRLKEEQDKNKNLVERVDALAKTLDTLKTEHETEVKERDGDVKNLRNTMEVQTEVHSSHFDELKFQIHSLRNKIDSSRTPGKSAKILNDVPVSDGSSATSSPVAPRKLLHHQDSCDSGSLTNSSPCLLSRSPTIHRGECIWRINAFSKKLHRIQSGSYQDPSRCEPFQTGQYGYRMCMWAYLNGRGKGEGKCISFYIRVMSGEFDPVLTWPIRPCYTFYLISQDPDNNKKMDLVRVRDLSLKNHGGIARPQKDDKSIIVGFDDFVSHDDLEKKMFLVDDSLFIKCVVEVPQTV